MWSRPRSWPFSVSSRSAGRPAGRPGSGRSRSRGRWQRCLTLRRFERYSESWRRLYSNHCTVDCTHGSRTPGEVVFNTIFFVFKIKIFKKMQKIYEPKWKWLAQKNCIFFYWKSQTKLTFNNYKFIWLKFIANMVGRLKRQQAASRC